MPSGLERRDAGAELVDLALRTCQVQPCGAAALHQPLGQAQALLLQRERRLSGGQLVAGGADLDIGVGDFGRDGDADQVAGGLDRLVIRLGRLDAPTDPAEQVELVGGGEADVIEVDDR